MTATDYPNWFKQIAQHNFEQFLLPEAGKSDLQYLQLGVFTGDASRWLLDNVLTGTGCKLTDVDTWQGAHNEPIQTQIDFSDVYKTYLDSVGGNTDWHRMSTFDYLIDARRRRQINNPYNWRFDFVYVDAHHTSASALLDCELSWPLLKSGGILAIDDYEWLHPDGVDIHAPKIGIHMFLDRHDGEYEELVRNSQVWIRKK